MKKYEQKNQKKIIAIIFITIIISNYIFVYGANDFSVNAKASIIVEENLGKIIYEENSNIQNYPASVTKILTAILTLENCQLTDTVTVSKTAISNIPSGYVIAPLFVGEKMSVEDLLYALMLKSANDAAYVLAEHVGGTIEGFSDMMNKKAEELGCENSHFYALHTDRIDFIEFGRLFESRTDDEIETVKQAFEKDPVDAALKFIFPVEENETEGFEEYKADLRQEIAENNIPVYWNIKPMKWDPRFYVIEVAIGKYVIQQGDTLSNIAEQFDTSVEEILRQNYNIDDQNLIYAGNYLCIW